MARMTPVYIAGYDGSTSSARAVAFAERLGAATGAEVVAVTVREVTGWSGRGTLGVPEALVHEDTGDRALVVGAMSVAAGLHALAREEDASLLVVGETHRSAVRRAVRGSVAEQLLHGASCPVLVVPDSEPDAIDVIGVASARGPVAEPAAVAEGLAAMLGARVVRLDVVDPRTELAGACSREGVGLLVIGSRGLRPLREALTGSVSRELADHAPCPLILVPGGVRTDLAGLSPPATA
jgi:nucleotide-binding universal stress UspA family protein